MRVRFMKKTSLFLIFALNAVSVFAFENFTIKITPETGITNGNLYEYVFEDKCTNTDNQESFLDWQVKNLFFAGVNLESDIKKYFNISFDCRVYIPKLSGKMQDFDWLNFSNYPDDNPMELTNYSIHDNYLEKFYKFGISAGKNFLLDKIKLTPYLAWNYSFIQFSGKNGYGLYKWNKRNNSFEGLTVIDYNNEINSFLLGFKTIVTPSQHFEAGINFALSPALSFISAIDKHYENTTASGTLYLDVMNFSWDIKSSVFVRYSFNKYNSIGFKCDAELIPLTKGSDYSCYLPATSVSINQGVQGGTSRFLFSASIFYTLSL